MTVDQEGFKALMEEQKVRARKAREALGDLGWAGIEFGKDMPATEFVGYDRSSEQGRVLALVADGELRDELAQRASWCWTRRRSMPRWAARWETTAPFRDPTAPSR